MNLFRKLINININLSRSFEKLFQFNSDDRNLLMGLFNSFSGLESIADVGGGKKPAKAMIGKADVDFKRYDGFDISIDELNAARHLYTNIYKIDLTKKINDFNNTYDFVICLNTLEHVLDAEQSIKNLSAMLSEGGKLYIKLPCKHAAFAKLNLIMPNDLKKSIMHKLLPGKVGDGFKVYYDKSTPKDIVKICKDCGLDVININLVKWSSYFSVFFPLYVAWRLYTIIQNLFIDDYCESFEVVAVKEKA